MKVCFLAGTLGYGGAERQLLYMLRALQQADIAVRIICLTRGEFFEREVADLGIQIDWVGSRQTRVARLFEIIKKLRQQPADILQSAHFYTNIYAGLSGRIVQIPSIGAIRSDLQSEVRAHGLMGKWQLFLPKHLIANTELACRRATSEYGIAPSQIDLVRNVVEIGEQAELTRSDNFPHLNLLFVGRLVKLKRADLFVKLALLLEQQLPNYRLNFQIVGDGLLRTELEQMANDLRLKQNQISFLGWQNEMSEIYRQADLLVLTSEYEGSPNVLLEAMSYVVPAIATKVGGVPEILDETRGILIESNDETGLVRAAKELILNADLRIRLGREGRRYVGENHSIEYLKNRLPNIYSKLLT